MALPLLVLATAVLLGFRQFVGWVYALVLCVAWDLALVGIIFQIIALGSNNFTTRATAVFWLSLLPTIISVPEEVIVVAVLLNQALFVSLLVKRREFAR